MRAGAGYDLVRVLFEEFTRVAEELMLSRGWSAEGGDRSIGARFARLVSEGFVATAWLCPGRGPLRRGGGGGWEGHEPPLNAFAMVGVSCPAADRIVRALSADRGSPVAISEDVGDLLSPPRDVRIKITSTDQVRAAAESLVALVDEHAVAFASEYASVDALLAGLRSQSVDGDEWWYVPALLVACGRQDEAREALTSYGQTVDSQGFRRLSTQLTRLLDGEVTLEELEGAIPADPVRSPGSTGSIREIAAKQREARAAVDAVRAASDGTTRDQHRELLRAELERRGLSESATWVESRLDTLEPDYKAPSTASALASLGKLALAVRRAVKMPEPADDPAWLVPPARASYDLALYSPEELAVDLDPDAEDWLDRVHAAANFRVGDVVRLTVWLDWATAADAEPLLAVAIGANRVGRLNTRASQAFATAMAAAAIRGELPRTTGQLTRRPTSPRYILEIPRPQGA